MRILLSNDDGIHAPGLASLVKALEGVGEVFVVAPLEEKSTTGHSLTLAGPLRVKKFSERSWGVSGFPADCILMAMGHFLKDHKPDLIISGINRGPNVGQDVYLSGTIAAARQAVFHGIPAVAVSLFIKDFMHPKHETTTANYDTAANYIRGLVEKEVHLHLPPMHLLNVNVPDLPENEIRGVKICGPDFSNYSEEILERPDPHGRKYFWIASKFTGYDTKVGSDASALMDDHVAVSLLNLLPDPADMNKDLKRITGAR